MQVRTGGTWLSVLICVGTSGREERSRIVLLPSTILGVLRMILNLKSFCLHLSSAELTGMLGKHVVNWATSLAPVFVTSLVHCLWKLCFLCVFICDQHTGCCHLLTFVNSDKHGSKDVFSLLISLWTSYAFILRRGIAGLHGFVSN